jgi:S-adenosylmethionine decarboxylase
MILGQHILIECHGDHAMLDSNSLEKLMVRAAKAANATVLYHYFHKFGGHGGVTGVLVLAESHISVHTWPESQYAAFDIFMCGDAKPLDAAKVIVDAYPQAEVCIRSVDRGHPLDVSSNVNQIFTNTVRHAEKISS